MSFWIKFGVASKDDSDISANPIPHAKPSFAAGEKTHVTTNDTPFYSSQPHAF
jgi:hypothetical protein